MEKILADNMRYGRVPDVTDDGPSLLAVPDKAGTWNTAGNGKRKYFTTDLVTQTLKNNTEITLKNHRDRIYFYVDENIEVWHLGDDPTKRTRTATVQLTYYEDGIEKGTRQLILEQAKLLEVKFHDSENNEGVNYDESGKKLDQAKRIIYIEAYEEYLDHGDPLDEYNNNLVFTGLPWGGESKEVGQTRVGSLGSLGWTPVYKNSYENVWWGFQFTPIIVDKTEKIQNLTLNEKPETAAGYCYIKNKRNTDGTVTNPKWYLPGIRELERILEDYYIEYPEFQNNYYWSSAAGEDNIGIIGDRFVEDQQRARATKAYIGTDGKFHYYESGDGHDYTHENGIGGAALRTQPLRIRAARIDANPQ